MKLFSQRYCMCVFSVTVTYQSGEKCYIVMVCRYNNSSKITQPNLLELGKGTRMKLCMA